MRSNSLRAVSALGCLAFVLAGCSPDSPDPTQPNLAASVQTSLEVLESDFVLNPRGCAPENIALHFRTAFRFQSVVANDQRFIESIQIVERGSSGVGVETGTLYRLAGGHHEAFSTGQNGTATLVAFQRFVSQGSGANFTFRIQLHFTMSPDGDIVTEIERIDTEC
jgi:hypothetical protein